MSRSVELVLPLAFFYCILAQRGLCLCVFIQTDGVIVRRDDEPREYLWCMVIGRVIPASNMEGNRGEEVDLFCLAVQRLSKQILLLLWGTQGTPLGHIRNLDKG